MELRHLRYFVAVAEEGHFGRAAERLYVSQPSLSQQIRALEDELGLELFVRGPRGTQLTEAGGQLLEHARATLGRADQTLVAMRALAAGAEGDVIVGRVGQAAAELTGPIIAAFREAHPRVQLRPRELDFANQTGALLAGEVDVALLRPPLGSNPRLRVEILAVEPLVAILPVSHRLAGRREVRAAELLDEPFIDIPGAPPEWMRHHQLTDHRAGAPAQLVEWEATTPAIINEVVATGVAIMTAPASTERFYPHPGVRFVPVADAAGAPMAMVLPAQGASVAARGVVRAGKEVAGRLIELLPGARLPG